jgi:hypothetical protein
MIAAPVNIGMSVVDASVPVAVYIAVDVIREDKPG